MLDGLNGRKLTRAIHTMESEVGRDITKESFHRNCLLQSIHGTAQFTAPLAQVFRTMFAHPPTQCVALQRDVMAISTSMGRLWIAASSLDGDITIGPRGNVSAHATRLARLAIFAPRQCGQCLHYMYLSESFKCSACRAAGFHVRYCSTACQRKHWPLHKQSCKSIKRDPA